MLEFVPFVWEVACFRCVCFVGLFVLVIVCAVVVAVRYVRICASGRVSAGNCVFWFVSCPVAIAYAVEHSSVATWLWCLLALAVIASSLCSGEAMAPMFCVCAPWSVPTDNFRFIPEAAAEEGQGQGE